MKKKIYIPFILVIIAIAGFLGFQQINAATYEQPLYASMDAVATADGTANAYQRDVVGNKEDSAAAGAVTTTESLMAYVKQLVGAQISGDSNTAAILVDTGTTIPASLTILEAAASPSYSHPNYIAVATGTFDTTGVWSTVASHEIATVTGMVRMVIIPEVVTTVSSVSDTGTMQLGDEVATDSIIAASTLGSGVMAAGELWVDATLTRTILTRTQLNAIEIVVAGGQDIGYEVVTNAISGGSMIFHIYWTPLDATGAVAAGAGGTL